MKLLLTYLAQSGLCLAVFYLAYELLLKTETFFQLNRIFLVSGLWFSVLIPAFPITSPFRTLIVPASAVDSPPFAAAGGGFGWAGWLLILYGAGALIFLFRFGLQLAKLRRVVLTYGVRRLRGVKIVAVDRLFSPFSFFDIIFLNPGPSLDANLRRILAHEQVHIRQQHTLDVLFMEIVLSFQWFNPFVWPYKKALQETHEYLADSGVIAQGFSPVRYQLHMFEQNVGASLFEFGNNFKKSQIKRRIIMLSKMKSPGPARLKVLVALPLALGLVLAFAQPRLVAGPAAAQETATVEHEKAKALQVKEEMAKLLAMEEAVRKQMQTAATEEEKKELAAKIETIAKKRQVLSVGGNGALKPHPADLEMMAKELKAKQEKIKIMLEKSTDDAEKAKWKKELVILYEKEKDLKAMREDTKVDSAADLSVEKIKQQLADLKAKQAEVEAKIAETTVSGQKAKLEQVLKDILAQQAALKAEFQKAMEKAEKQK